MKTVAILSISISVVLLSILIMVLFSPKNEPDYNCSDFKSYSVALRVYKKDVTDPYHLDADKDGIPCEALLNKSR